MPKSEQNHTPQPIFIVGRARSGTTGLANRLAEHPAVASVHGDIPGSDGGIAESAFFSHFYNKFGDLNKYSNLAELVESFAPGTFFEVAGLEKELLYAARPTTYGGFFQVMMDELTRRQDGEAWLEKTPAHALYLPEIHASFPHARYIAIVRDMASQLRSLVRAEEKVRGRPLGGNGRRVFLAKHIYQYHATVRAIRAFRREHPDAMLVLDFREFVQDTEECLRKVCAFVGLPFDEALLSPRYGQVSSFRSEAERRKTLTPADKGWIRVMSPFLRLLPVGLMRFLRDTSTRFDGVRLPLWFYSTILRRWEREDGVDPRFRFSDEPLQRREGQ